MFMVVVMLVVVPAISTLRKYISCLFTLNFLFIESTKSPSIAKTAMHELIA